MSAPLLSARHLSVYLKTDHRPLQVVSDISFDIKKGEVFGFVGESGCGKSLTALSILRILPANAYAEGQMLLDGKDLFALSEDEMRRKRGKDISIVFQEPMTSLNPVLTVGYQIAETIHAHFEVSRKDAMDRTIELLQSVKIPSPEVRLKDYPHQLSGGMRQRVMIAMAIACSPSLLIADEPTTALDVTIQAQILELLQGLRQQMGMGIFLITHDLSIISEQAERVAIMYGGSIMELANVDEIFLNPLHPYTKGLLASVASVRGRRLKPIQGAVPPAGLLPPGCRFSDRCAFVIEACCGAEPHLLEISSNHFVRCIRAGSCDDA
jgi:oligopeptide/dipeptide ABC transporter ATP-binding protein